MSRIRDSNVAVSPYAAKTCQGHRELQPGESGKTRSPPPIPTPPCPAAPTFQTPSLHSPWRIRNRS